MGQHEEHFVESDSEYIVPICFNAVEVNTKEMSEKYMQLLFRKHLLRELLPLVEHLYVQSNEE